MRYLICLCVFFLSAMSATANHSTLRVDPFNTLPDSNTATFRTNSQKFWDHEDAQVEGERSAPFIFSGGLHGTSVTLTSPAFATVAYVPERVNQVSTAITYVAIANDVCWTIISSDNNGITGWTRAGTTAYYYQCEGDITPNRPVLPANSTWLMRVTITNSAIATVSDLRIGSPLYHRIGCIDPSWPIYGAVGDGVALDQVALQSAIARAEAETEVMVLDFLMFTPSVCVRRGRFLVTGLTITRTLGFFGVDKSATQLVSATNGNVINVNVPAASWGDYQPNTLKDFSVHCQNNGTSQNGIRVTSAARVSIQNVFVYNCGNDGINISVTVASQILFSESQYNTRYGVYANSDSPGTALDISHSMIRRNLVGIYIDEGNTIPRFTNNIIESNVNGTGTNNYGSPARPAVGIWINAPTGISAYQGVMLGNYFENHLLHVRLRAARNWRLIGNTYGNPSASWFPAKIDAAPAINQGSVWNDTNSQGTVFVAEHLSGGSAGLTTGIHISESQDVHMIGVTRGDTNPRGVDYNDFGGGTYQNLIMLGRDQRGSGTGQLSVSGGGPTGSIVFAVAEPDANYILAIIPTTVSGAPAIGSNRIKSISKLTSGFTITVEADPGPGNRQDFDWVLFRRP